MFFVLPITTRSTYLLTYGNRVVHRLYNLDCKNKRHYVLLNHARTISKGRILDQFIINHQKVVLSKKTLKGLRKAYLRYYDFYLSKPFIEE